MGAKISIITPAYNAERFIESCIKSVIDQAYLDVEHLIIDGGSTDRTVEIIQRYAETRPHIRWISERDNGQSDAMNKGILMAGGVIIGILNADDFYEPNTLNRVSEIFITLPEPSLLVGNCKVIDENGSLLWLNKPHVKFHQLLQVWRYRMPNNPSSYFYHRSLHNKIGAYDTDEHYVMDYDFLLRAFQASKVTYVDETFGDYRMYAGTKTSESVAQGNQWDMICRLSLKYAAQKGALYNLYMGLSIALLHESLKNIQAPSLSLRMKWRLMRDGLKMFDKLVESMERIRG